MAQRIYQAGERIGPYEVVRPLGFGGMGAVYEARDGEARFAVKVLTYERDLLSPEEDAEDVQRMRREFSALLPLTHPNIVRVYAFGWTEDGLPYFSMERVHGRSFKEWMKSRPDVGNVLEVFQKLAAALKELHRLGLVHRDLKPSNVLLRESGGPVLIDFGIVQTTVAPTLTLSYQFLGTFLYFAPELASCVLAVDEPIQRPTYTPAYDVHALGVMLYEALTGKNPFSPAVADPLGLLAARAIQNDTPRHPSDVEPSLPRPLGDLVMWMLRKKPEERPRDGGQVEVALSALRRGEVPPMPGSRAGHRPVWRAAALGAVTAAVVGAVLVLLRTPATAPSAKPEPVVLAPASNPPPPEASPSMPDPGSSTVSSVPAEGAVVNPPHPAPARRASRSTTALTACAMVLSACVGAEVRPDGVPAFCPRTPREGTKGLGAWHGFEFEVTVPKEDVAKRDYGWGPGRLRPDGSRTQIDPRGVPRVLLPASGAIELEYDGPALSPGTGLQVPPEFPFHTRVYGVVQPGKERIEITFTRLKFPDGREFPICAVAYSTEAWRGGQRGLPIPDPPPDPPPGHVLIDTFGFPVHALEPF